MISAVVIVCTAVLLGSILTVAYLVNRDSDDDGTTNVADEGADTGGDDGGEDGGEDTGEDSAEAAGDPDGVAVIVIEMMYGVSDEDPDAYVCSTPGPMLNDLEATSEEISETLGDTLESIEDWEFTAMDSSTQGETAEVEVGIEIYGTETSIGTIELIVEDGSWRACDFTL